MQNSKTGVAALLPSFLLFFLRSFSISLAFLGMHLIIARFDGKIQPSIAMSRMRRHTRSTRRGASFNWLLGHAADSSSVSLNASDI